MSNLDIDPASEFSMQMVAELAAKIQEPNDVLARYGMSKKEFATLSKTPAFKHAYQEAKTFWESDSNAKERIAVKAATMLEDSLLELHTIFHDGAKSGSLRMDAFKQITVLARLNGGEMRDPSGGAAGQQININIDMGGGQSVVATIDPVNNPPEDITHG